MPLNVAETGYVGAVVVTKGLLVLDWPVPAATVAIPHVVGAY